MVGNRKRILWLVSWYPNKNDRFDGDFIQRHARAAAICHDIHVIFVTDADIAQPLEEEWNYATGLTEQIIYFKKASGIFSRFRKQWKWRNVFQEAVERYIEKNGLPDHVHVHIPWKAGWIALWMKRKYKTGFILSEHWGIYTETVADHFYTKSKLQQKIIKEIFNEADTLISVSGFLAGSIEQVIGRRPELIIPNVVDTSLFLHRDKKYSKFSFVHVSNMVPLKNVRLILEAFQQMVQETGSGALQLIMIGNRDKNYAQLAEEMGILNSSVFFVGEIPYREVAEEMSRCHGFVLFSDSETFSCVTAEALCSGLPVIASRVGALPELVTDANGLLVSSKNKDSLVQAMIQVWQTYADFRPEQIAEDAAKKYSYAAIASAFEKLYR